MVFSLSYPSDHWRCSRAGFECNSQADMGWIAGEDEGEEATDEDAVEYTEDVAGVIVAIFLVLVQVLRVGIGGRCCCC